MAGWIGTEHFGFVAFQVAPPAEGQVRVGEAADADAEEVGIGRDLGDEIQLSEFIDHRFADCRQRKNLEIRSSQFVWIWLIGLQGFLDTVRN